MRARVAVWVWLCGGLSVYLGVCARFFLLGSPDFVGCLLAEDQVFSSHAMTPPPPCFFFFFSLSHAHTLTHSFATHTVRPE